MTEIAFAKMHALGNDFIVVESLARELNLTPTLVRRLAFRREGIGCDQILQIAPPRIAAADFRFRVFNADGNEVGQCGNGARCIPAFLRRRGLFDGDSKKEIQLESGGGILSVFGDEKSGGARLPPPLFAPEKIPLNRPRESRLYSAKINGEDIEFAAVSLGNPHAVIRAENIDDSPVEKVGAALNASADFPEGVNVGFYELISGDAIRLRVYERGAGETPSCGSGACAAAIIAARDAGAQSSLTVYASGGELRVIWGGGDSPPILQGAVAYVFDGKIDLDLPADVI